VKRAVYLRDLGRCAHVGANGRRCEASCTSARARTRPRWTSRTSGA
jgi:hypothetical protein